MQQRFNVEFIRAKAEAVLLQRGMSAKDAPVFVDSMLAADMRGVSTHGIRMLPSYIEKIDRGAFSFNTPIILRQLPAFTVMDAGNTVGAVSATYAADLAIEHAGTSGIHAVFSRNANTFGPGFYYAERIANAGMIGFVCCNAPAAMPAFNGLEAMLGTNPLAFAAPTKSYGSIVMDMATSVVSKSRFGVAKMKGEKLELGWALDKDGNPTTDPDEGIRGLVLPMAGFKGYGIAMMIDIMAGFLSGAACLNGVGKFYSPDDSCMNVGHMIVAVNPALIYDGDFLADMDRYVGKLKASKVVDGKRIIIPGEERNRRKVESQAIGIELTPDVLEKLERVFGENLRIEDGI